MVYLIPGHETVFTLLCTKSKKGAGSARMTLANLEDGFMFLSKSDMAKFVAGQLLLRRYHEAWAAGDGDLRLMRTWLPDWWEPRSVPGGLALSQLSNHFFGEAEPTSIVSALTVAFHPLKMPTIGYEKHYSNVAEFNTS